jgi:hypothetical protein
MIARFEPRGIIIAGNIRFVKLLLDKIGMAGEHRIPLVKIRCVAWNSVSEAKKKVQRG